MNAVAEKDKQVPVAQERNYVSPEVDIFETPEGYILHAEMPGVPKEGLEVTLENNTLTFTGHRKQDAVKGTVLYRESRPADYRRVFELDPAVDVDKIGAEMRQGVLRLTLPKAERVKPRRIEIK
jgi:HSP20 family protein